MLVHKCLNGRAPQYLIDKCRLAGGRRSGKRSAGCQNLKSPVAIRHFGDGSFAAAAPQVWNSLPDYVRDLTLRKDTLAKHLNSHFII